MNIKAIVEATKAKIKAEEAEASAREATWKAKVTSEVVQQLPEAKEFLVQCLTKEVIHHVEKGWVVNLTLEGLIQKHWPGWCAERRLNERWPVRLHEGAYVQALKDLVLEDSSINIKEVWHSGSEGSWDDPGYPAGFSYQITIPGIT